MGRQSIADFLNLSRTDNQSTMTINQVLGLIIIISSIIWTYKCYKHYFVDKTDTDYISTKCFAAGFFGFILGLILLMGKSELI